MEEWKRTSGVPKVHNEASDYDYVCDKIQPIWFVPLGIGLAVYTPWLQILT